MRTLLNKRWIVAFLLLFSVSIFAASPVAVLQGASQRMINQLEKNKSRLKSSRTIYRIVTRTLMPYVDVNRMAASVVGRQYWSKASASQRSQFVRQFRRLVISTYSNALSSYNGDKVKFYPSRSNYQRARTAKVRSVLIRRNGRRIPISYNVVRRGSTWKIYDFSIENVSMSQSYRAQFSGVLARSGMKGLIKRLANHNRTRR